MRIQPGSTRCVASIPGNLDSEFHFAEAMASFRRRSSRTHGRSFARPKAFFLATVIATLEGDSPDFRNCKLVLKP